MSCPYCGQDTPGDRLAAARRGEFTDTQILDWLERNLLHVSHARMTNSVDMAGIHVHGQLVNEARKAGAGPSHFRVKHKSIREAVIDAMRTPGT